MYVNKQYCLAHQKRKKVYTYKNKGGGGKKVGEFFLGKLYELI